MTPNEIIQAVNDLERLATARLRNPAWLFVTCTAHRQYWVVTVHLNTPSKSFQAGTPEECFEDATTWVNSYAPAEDRLADLLGCKLVTA